MGLIAALNTSVSGLNINQQNLDVLSQNIANANTPNYSNEVVNQQAEFIGGAGSGVDVASYYAHRSIISSMPRHRRRRQ